MGEAFESGEGVINDVVAGRTAEAGDKAGTAGVMVRMAPVGAHTGARLPLAPVGWQVHDLFIGGSAGWCTTQKIDSQN